MKAMRTRDGLSLIAALTLLALLPALLYFSGYFLRGTLIDMQRGRYWREFPTAWERVLYAPAARLESLVTGNDVAIPPPPSTMQTPK